MNGRRRWETIARVLAGSSGNSSLIRGGRDGRIGEKVMCSVVSNANAPPGSLTEGGRRWPYTGYPNDALIVGD